jgi:molybdenum cofactor synthesis domain-containing protein
MPSDFATKTAAMVVIGNEILSGKVTDSNSPFLAKELRAAGVSLERIAVIPDDVDLIGQTVAGYAESFDFVFTSGGVGPTHDDMTMDGIAVGFGVKVIEHSELREMIAQAVGGTLSPSHLKMAQVPDGAELVGDHKHFPTVRMRNVYVLPGIPEIFEAKIAGLRERFAGEPYHLRQILVSVSETRIADFLNETLAEFPELMLGSYPKFANEEYSVRLTLESKNEDYLEAALADLVGRMPETYIVEVVR